MKSSEVSTKTRSTPALLSFKGQATKHTTVKWSIQRVWFHPKLEFVISPGCFPDCSLYNYSWIIILLLISQLWYTDIYRNKSIVLCFVWIVILKGKRTSSLFFEGAGRKLHSRSDVLRCTCTTNWNSVHGIQTEKGWLCSNYYFWQHRLPLMINFIAM